MPQLIRIGGVPEHFNMPWHWAIEKGLFLEQDIELIWTEYPTGTGAMVKDLRNQTLDVAILLTEGMVADIINGNEAKILQFYVKSPLVWGIHVGYHSPIKEVDEIEGKKYAISRLGSGSHLMAYVDAHQRGFPFSEDQLVLVNNLDGAVKALSDSEADIFMWEKFMTKPYVDKGIFRRIGECPTPWPCFVIAVQNEFLEKHSEFIGKMLSVINTATKNFRNIPDLAILVSEKYHLQETDVKEWLKTVEWSSETNIEPQILEDVMDTLVMLGITHKKLPVANITAPIK